MRGGLGNYMNGHWAAYHYFANGYLFLYANSRVELESQHYNIELSTLKTWKSGEEAILALARTPFNIVNIS